MELTATDGAAVQPGDRPIAVGGTGEGADTAIPMKAAFSQDLMAKHPTKRPEVYEILARSATKKWWWQCGTWRTYEAFADAARSSGPGGSPRGQVRMVKVANADER